MPPYATIEKAVGETPLEALQRYRKDANLPAHTPIAYAGRLDPMASGTLLLLIGDECKKQKQYHSLDKGYTVSVLFGTSSDSGDPLGLLEWGEQPGIEKADLLATTRSLTGKLTLPYPKFSSKTVAGKPLHVWTLEKRLDEIDIPLATTTIHKIDLREVRTVSASKLFEEAQSRIESITPVTDESKRLGADFRRDEVRLAWRTWLEYHQGQQLPVATFSCVCSSGTYMRALAEEIGRRMGTQALAFSIHRDTIGHFQPLGFGWGFWRKRY